MTCSRYGLGYPLPKKMFHLDLESLGWLKTEFGRQTHRNLCRLVFSVFRLVAPPFLRATRSTETVQGYKPKATVGPFEQERGSNPSAVGKGFFGWFSFRANVPAPLLLFHWGGPLLIPQAKRRGTSSRALDWNRRMVISAFFPLAFLSLSMDLNKEHFGGDLAETPPFELILGHRWFLCLLFSFLCFLQFLWALLLAAHSDLHLGKRQGRES